MAIDREDDMREEMGVKAESEEQELVIMAEGRRTENIVMEEPEAGGKQEEQIGENVGIWWGMKNNFPTRCRRSRR